MSPPVSHRHEPSGGQTNGKGLLINWQIGPMKRVDGVAINTEATLEMVIFAAIQRLEYFQSTKFACSENAKALGIGP